MLYNNQQDTGSILSARDSEVPPSPGRSAFGVGSRAAVCQTHKRFVYGRILSSSCSLLTMPASRSVFTAFLCIFAEFWAKTESAPLRSLCAPPARPSKSLPAVRRARCGGEVRRAEHPPRYKTKKRMEQNKLHTLFPSLFTRAARRPVQCRQRASRRRRRFPPASDTRRGIPRRRRSRSA